jgi:serine/threonine protein kinase
VYKAFDNSSTVFAIKYLDKNCPTLKGELDVLTQTDHDHIIKYHEFIDAPECPQMIGLVLEFADVGTLTSAIERGNCDTVEFNVWRFMAQMASALDYLHTMRPHILHRLLLFFLYCNFFFRFLDSAPSRLHVHPIVMELDFIKHLFLLHYFDPNE